MCSNNSSEDDRGRVHGERCFGSDLLAYGDHVRVNLEARDMIWGRTGVWRGARTLKLTGRRQTTCTAPARSSAPDTGPPPDHVRDLRFTRTYPPYASSRNRQQRRHGPCHDHPQTSIACT